MAAVAKTKSRNRLSIAQASGSIIMLVVVVVFFAIVAPGFFTFSNMTNIIRQGSILALAAFGQTFVILLGGIDLSVGAIMGLTSSVIATLMLRGMSPMGAVLIALIIAVACGLINGLIVNVIGLDSFVATFGMWSMALGIALVITEERTLYGFSSVLRVLHDGTVFGIPIPLLIVILIWAILNFFLKRTAMGTSIYAIGSNMEAAKLSGIPVIFRKTMLYGFSSFMAGLAGIMFLARSNSASAIDPIGYEFDTICAVVLGGTALSGGRGGVKETLIGVTLLATLRNGMNVAGVNTYLQLVLLGLILILAFAGENRRRKREKETCMSMRAAVDKALPN